MDQNLVIAATHNGIFHADDCFAAAVLTLAVPGVEFVRSRDPKILDTADVVFDVGGVHDATTRRFDHHQRGGAGARPNGVQYSSFGLVWNHYAPALFGSEVARMVDASLVQTIDAGDNGQVVSVPAEGFEDVRQFGISAAISAMNPTWDQPRDDCAFDRAVAVARLILGSVIASCQAKERASNVIRQAIADVHDPRLVVLETYVPWQDVLVAESQDALFVVFPATTGDEWMVQSVPTASGGPFSQRKAFPEAWAGFRGAEFAAVSGVADAVFCHAGRFVCAAVSRVGALELARRAIG